MNILSRLRGEHIAAARRTLPDCRTCKDDFFEVEFGVPAFGPVLFLFRRMRAKKGKSVHWFWSAQAAVLAEEVRGN